MGKMQDPREPVARFETADGFVIVHGTAEQREKNQAAIEWLERQQQEYEKLTPAQKEELERQWEQFERTMNETRRSC